MSPYYEQDGITIYHADCRDILPHVTADVTIADPEYGDTDLDWDRIENDWIPLVPSVQLWTFASMRYALKAGGEFVAAGWRFAQDVVWEKHNGSGIHTDRFRRVHEHALHFYRGPWGDLPLVLQHTRDATKRTVRRKQKPTHYGDIGAAHYRSVDGGPRLMRSVMQIRSCHGKAVHPTQKPAELVARLLRYSGGESVLDPFMGSGTTLVAAKQLGRRAIGVEIEEKFCEIAAKRLAQRELFGIT